MGIWDLFRKKPAPATPPEQPREKPPETVLPVAAPPVSPPPPTPDSPPPVPAYSAGDFLPIARDDLLQQGQDVRRTTGWMWFGRRDLIPPASDPRTKLIDRGMVTQGFLTADDLAEMHAVGDEHAKYANRIEHIQIQAGKTAEAAVEADRAARAERKARLRAESAERKRARAEDIAARKTTDIVFAGRGVSALLHDRTSDEAKLTAAGLPVLHTPADLAVALGLPLPKLRWLCFHTEAATRIHYVQFEVPKKTGGTRTLSAPHALLASVQDWVLGSVLAKLPTHDAAHGFVPGRSTLTNAAPHAGKDVVVNVDLEAFFPSISFPRVRHLFRRCGYSGAVATLLALVCTECPRRKVTYAGTVYFVATGPRGLPQGACSSPAISNLIGAKLDRRLGGFAAKLGFTYTRYADDLTFSAGPGLRDKVGYLLAKVRHVAEEEGFAVNAKKTRVQRPETRQTVTGLVVNAAPAVPRDVVRRVRAILHRAKTEGLAAQNREKHPDFPGWVAGMIAYIAMTKPAEGAKLRAALAAVGRSGSS